MRDNRSMQRTFIDSTLIGLLACVGTVCLCSPKIEAHELGRFAGGLVSSPTHRPGDITPAPSRRLQEQETGSAFITVVSTSDDFMSAAIAGAEHIELRDHIILEEHGPPWDHLELPISVKSIRGICADKPFPSSGDMGTGPLVPALLPQQPGQCILMLSATLSFHGTGTKTDRSEFSGPVTVLERLYIRAKHHLNTMHIDSDRDLYMSNVTLQGGVSIEEGPPDGAGGARLQGALFAEGTTFSDLVPDDLHPYVISASDPVSLLRCTFHNNHVHPPAGALIVASLHGKARLEQCSYTGNSVSQDFFDNNANNPAVFYSDESRTVGFLLGDDILTSPLESSGDDFMSAHDGRAASIRMAIQAAENHGATGDSIPAGGGGQLNYGLSPPESLPPTIHSPPPGRNVDDANPAPGATDHTGEHSAEEHDGEHGHATDHTHAPDHKHWWHFKSAGSCCLCGTSLQGLMTLPLLSLLVLAPFD